MNRPDPKRAAGPLGGVSRRRFLGTAGALAAAAAVAPAALNTSVAGAAPTRVRGAAVDFHGVHQAGIVTPAQDRLLFASFDLGTTSRDDVVALLETWTRAAQRMAAGEPVGNDNSDLLAPPEDTGEAVGLPPSNLTLTFGFGPGLFARDGVDRYGLASARPAPLADLPAFPFDELQPARSGGDLAVQACADDPQVCFHAIRNLTRLARGTAVLRWSQVGFGRTSSTSQAQQTPRNLMGFKDGTNNLTEQDTALLDEQVWVGAKDQPAWMANGTYLVARRIRMLIEVWDRSTLDDQQLTIGRVKVSGAPLGARAEHDAVDLKARRDGKLLIPSDAHIRLSAPAVNHGAHLLRRGYSFADGIDPATNQLDAGLFFLAFQRDPRTQFVAIQNRLGESDALNEYIKHTGSALFAIPPGVRSAGGFVGESLLA
jgi:deferrochelatase/peroxidase EfeB